MEFFWDMYHWVPKSLLFLLKEEGGQDLIHLASRATAFHLQFIQRLLTGNTDLVWRPLSCCFLQQLGELGLSQSLFLMDSKKTNTSSLPYFYQSVFTVWTLLEKQRQGQTDSLYCLLKEPVLFEGHLDAPGRVRPTLSKLFHTAFSSYRLTH